MTSESSSREERIIAALAGDLSGEEQRRFDAECAADPGLRAEVDAARSVLERLAQADLTWHEPDLPAGLEERVLRATAADPVASEASLASVAAAPALVPGAAASDVGPSALPEPPVPADLRQARARRASRRFGVGTLGAAAASALLVGGLAGAGIAQLSDAPAEGPPGTLGVLEPVAFTDVAEGAQFTGSVVAHTWGTETVLEIDGLRVGETFEVVLTRDDGAELVSGTFLGAEKTVTCRMNAAVLRQDVSAVEIRDTAGDVVATTALPDV